MVTDHYMPRWPQPTNISPHIYYDIQELLRKAEEYDRMTGQPKCPAPDKQKWLDDFYRVTMPPVNLNTIGPVVWD
jgi:hypothetical protein